MDRERWPVLVVVAGYLAFAWFLTMPANGQVCRASTYPILDYLHGTADQPTCQSIINHLDSRADAAERSARDLDDRVTDIESRLRM